MKFAQRKLKMLGPAQGMYHQCQQIDTLAAITAADQCHNYQLGKQHSEPNAAIAGKNFPIASRLQIGQPDVTPVFISQNNSRQEGRENSVRTLAVLRDTNESHQ